MTFTEQLLQFLVTGITNGSIYALIGLGFVVIYSVTSVINFAQGEFAMLGALGAVSLIAAGLPQGLAVVAAVIGVGIFAAFLYQVGLRPARDASPLTLIIITIGAGLAIRGAGLAIWGTDPYQMAAFTSGPPFQVGGAVVRLQSLWVLGTTLVLQPLLHLFFTRTMLGRSLRACAVNRLAARLMGIRTARMALLAFGLSGSVGALGGVIIAPIIFATYDMGLMLSLKGFVAAVMGGMVNYSAAVAGGFLLGILESLGAGFISSGYKDAVAFIALFIILLSKPRWLVRAEQEIEEDP
ncbi:MAG TPA: branched-chain amino acid ABC transporter permease [Candidatus Methylomirabilis sp.]|nr:branched-chain amino acid ABC transporter permease [Candidatus Methylomirabilis sp.]